MARIVITASADADTAFILDDLAAKAGVNIAARYDADFDPLYRPLERFPITVTVHSFSQAAYINKMHHHRNPLMTIRVVDGVRIRESRIRVY